jgi:hypothetical protein
MELVIALMRELSAIFYIPDSEANATIWQIAWGSSTNQVYIATRGRGILENRFDSEEYLPLLI